MHKAAKALASTAGAKSANGQQSSIQRCGSQNIDVDHVWHDNVAPGLSDGGRCGSTNTRRIFARLFHDECNFFAYEICMTLMSMMTWVSVRLLRIKAAFSTSHLLLSKFEFFLTSKVLNCTDTKEPKSTQSWGEGGWWRVRTITVLTDPKLEEAWKRNSMPFRREVLKAKTNNAQCDGSAAVPESRRLLSFWWMILD